MPAAKVAFEARRRFWEEDEHIYGGISWTTQDITQLWYPSTGMHAATGILVGAYIWTAGIGEAFARLSPAERLELALRQGEKLHPTYRADTRHGVSVCWGKIPFSEGAWCEWTPEARRSAYPVLLEPDGPLFLAGEHLSYLHGLAGRGRLVGTCSDQADRRAGGGGGEIGSLMRARCTSAAAARGTSIAPEEP